LQTLRSSQFQIPTLLPRISRSLNTPRPKTPPLPSPLPSPPPPPPSCPPSRPTEASPTARSAPPSSPPGSLLSPHPTAKGVTTPPSPPGKPHPPPTVIAPREGKIHSTPISINFKLNNKINDFIFAFHQEIPSETNDSSAGGEFEDRRYPCGRVLLEKVWSKTHQGITLPTVFFLLLPFCNIVESVKVKHQSPPLSTLEPSNNIIILFLTFFGD